MTKTKKNTPSANGVGEAKATDATRPLGVTAKAGRSEKCSVASTKAGAATLSLSDAKPPRTTRVTKAGKTNAKDKATEAKKPDAPRPAKSVEVEPTKGRATKQDQVLAMLSKSGGVTIDEMMVVTGWQQHSVRGFLAGTVRKKLGLDIASVKAEGSDRRYAIKTNPKQGR